MPSTRTPWLQARRTAPDGGWLIGGSESAACLGWDPWTSPLRLYHRKLRGDIEDSAEQEHQTAGRFFESGILKWYEHKLQHRHIVPTKPEDVGVLRCIHRNDDHGHIFQSLKHPWMSLTPDAWVVDQHTSDVGTVDAKNLALKKRKDWEPGVPPVYACQIVHYCVGSERTWGSFACAFGGQQLDVFDVSLEAMRTIVEPLLEAEKEMVRRLELKSPPPAGADPKERDMLAKLFPRPKGAELRTVAWVGGVTTDMGRMDGEEFDSRWQDAKMAAYEARDEVRRLEAVLLQLAEGADAVELTNGVRYVIGESRSGSVTVRRK